MFPAQARASALSSDQKRAERTINNPLGSKVHHGGESRGEDDILADVEGRERRRDLDRRLGVVAHRRIVLSDLELLVVEVLEKSSIIISSA